jgi:galactose mutarotase-like enzyme
MLYSLLDPVATNASIWPSRANCVIDVWTALKGMAMSVLSWKSITAESAETQSQGGTDSLGFQVHRLRGGIREGVEQIDISCGDLQFSVLPTRGMGIWKASVRGIDFGWDSPIHGPVHPAFVPLHEPSGLGFLDGFDELLTRCGLVSNGAPEFEANGQLKYPLHGRIANTPARRVDVHIDEQRESIEVRGTVEEARFHFQKLELSSIYHCRIGEPKILIHDTITNRSDRPATLQLLYHFNFGPPLLGDGAKFVAPVSEVAPRNVHAANAIEQWDHCGAAGSQSTELVFFMRLLGDTRHLSGALLHNAAQDLGVMLTFDLQQLPCFTLWKNLVSARDGYVVGLEPATNFPNARGFEERRGRVIELAAGESYEIRVDLGFCCGRESVDRALESIANLQSRPPRKLIWPSSEYSPEGETETAE